MAGRTGVTQLDPSALRAARKAKRLTQADLAARAGADKFSVSAWERGARWPFVHTLWRVADALDVTVRSLLRQGTPVTLDVLRICAGLTQDEVAERLGVSRPTWGAWERGETTVHAEDAPRIAAALGVTVAEVLAARDGETTTEVVGLPEDLVARLNRARQPGESLVSVLERLLPPE